MKRTVRVFERITTLLVMRAAGKKPHARQIVAGRHPGRDEHHVVAGQFLERKASLQIQDAGRAGRPRPPVRLRGVKRALHLAARRTNRGRRKHALMRPADADQQIDLAFGPGGGDRRGKVAGGKQLDSGAGATDLGDQFLMPRAVEDRDAQILDVDAFWPPPAPSGCRSASDRDRSRHGPYGPQCDFVHIGIGAIAVSCRARRARCTRARWDRRCAQMMRSFECVERHVDFGTRAGADDLAVVKHVRFGPVRLRR